jgi:glycosyltransferase involved in cell wall biosynthesis
MGINKEYILCLGNVVPVKNHETAIKAFKILDSYKDFKGELVIAGKKSHTHYKAIEKLVKKLGLESKVLFIGYQDQASCRYLYNGAKMLVHSSLHEGFGFTIIEAMGCGLPIVCPSTTSHPEITMNAARHYGYPSDYKALAATIKIVLNDDGLRESLSKNGLLRAKSFSWKKCVEENIDIYNYLENKKK